MKKKVLIGAGIIAGVVVAATAIASVVESRKIHDQSTDVDEDEEDYDAFVDEDELEEEADGEDAGMQGASL